MRSETTVQARQREPGLCVETGTAHGTIIDTNSHVQELFRPEKLAADRWIALFIFVLSLAYLWMFRRYTAIDPDEGIILQGAQRILQGQVLYRGFFSFITPGSYYFLAGVFKVFGSSIIVARTVLVFYGGLFSVFTYLMARRVCRRWVSLAMATLVTMTVVPWRFLTLHNWDSTLWTCAAVYCAVRLLEERHWGWAFAAGTFVSLTALFEQSKGAGLALGLGMGLISLPWLGSGVKGLRKKHWIALGAGLLWVWIPVVAYFGFQHALPAMWSDWLWPLHHYSAANKVPYGYQDWSEASRHAMFGSGPWLARGVAFFIVIPCFIIPALPLIAIILLAHWIYESRSDRKPSAPGRVAYYVLLCFSMVGLLLSIVISRQNIIHFVHVAPIYYLVLAWIIEGQDIRGSLTRSLRPIWAGLVLATFFTVGMVFLMRTRNATQPVGTRHGELMSTSRDEVLEYIQNRVPAGSKLLVYPYMPIYYYLTGTFSPVRYDYLQPGMHTLRQQREAIREIAEKQTPAVLLDLSFLEKVPASWPNTPLGDLAGDPVTDFILSHYRPCRALVSGTDGGWRYVFMVRNGLDCSAPYPQSPLR